MRTAVLIIHISVGPHEWSYSQSLQPGSNCCVVLIGIQQYVFGMKYPHIFDQVRNVPPTWSLVAFSLHWPLIPEVQPVRWCLVVLAPPGCTIKHYEQQPNSASNCNYLYHFKHHTAETAVTGESPKHIQTCRGCQTSKVKEQVCLLSFIVELFTALLARRSMVATSGIFDFPQLKLQISCFHFP